MAKLYFKYGVMSSAKSAELLLKAYQLRERNLKVLLLKSNIDTRDGANIIKSRAGLSDTCYSINEDTNIIDSYFNDKGHLLFKDIKLDFILVDEAQFLTEKQVEQLSYIVDNFNINVICYGLRTDFMTKLFPGSRRLFELADSIEEMKSVCSCGRKAIINARIDKDANIITQGNQVEIGSEDKYITLCRKCYFDKIDEKKRN